MRPRGCGPLEQPPNRVVAQPLSRLDDRAGRDPHAALARQRQIHRGHDLGERLVAHDAHPEHQPDHLFRRQPPTANRRGACRDKRLLDPLRIDAGAKARQEVIVGLRGENTVGDSRHDAIVILDGDRNKNLS